MKTLTHSACYCSVVYVLSPQAGRCAAAAGWDVGLSPVGGTHRIFTRPGNGHNAKPSPVLLQISIQPPDERAAHAQVVLSAQDFLDQPTA